jgi:hypothetical protein
MTDRQRQIEGVTYSLRLTGDLLGCSLSLSLARLAGSRAALALSLPRPFARWRVLSLISDEGVQIEMSQTSDTEPSFPKKRTRA